MLADNKLFETSVVFESNRNSLADIVVNQGGTSSGKTYSILQNLFLHAIEDDNQVITIVGQDIPNLKVGALRDAQTILEKSEILQSFVADPVMSSEPLKASVDVLFTNNKLLEP